MYWVSDLLSFVLSKVLNYRSAVIDENLLNSFPNKSAEERAAIKQTFYRNLSDIIVETIKSFTISKKSVLKRNRIINQELLDSWHEKNQPIIVVMGHQCNWEWALLRSALSLNQKIMVVYKPLSNRYFNQLFLKTRSRFGVTMIAMKDVKNYFINNQNESFCSAFVTDQSPSNSKRAEWIPFLNQETAVMSGTGFLAETFNVPVLFGTAVREGRGHYAYTMEPLIDHPKEAGSRAITIAHTKRLEAMIHEAPGHWLWSHKRWKHKRETA